MGFRRRSGGHAFVVFQKAAASVADFHEKAAFFRILR